MEGKSFPYNYDNDSLAFGNLILNRAMLNKIFYKGKDVLGEALEK